MTAEALAAGRESTPETEESLSGEAEGRFSVQRWQYLYHRGLVISDSAIVVLAVLTALVTRFGLVTEAQSLWDHRLFDYDLLSVVIIAAWLVTLHLFRTRDRHVVAGGPNEYRQVINASLSVFGGVAIAAYLAKEEIARGYLALALPLGVGLLLINRWVWRKGITAKRLAGRAKHRVLVLGHLESVAMLDQQLARHDDSAFTIVGLVQQEGGTANRAHTLRKTIKAWPASDEALAEALKTTHADTVAVASTETLGPSEMRRLSWYLHERQVELMIAPSLVDYASPRLTVRHDAGVPFIYLEEPRYEGATKWAKGLFDRLGALILLVVLAPVLLVAAIAVKTTSPGSVLYRQERIGLNRIPFQIIKFRSMYVDAEQRLERLQAQNDGNGVLFKMKHDPRVTQSGRWLRRFSIDELPQLFNVLRGEMSLVGPRPPLAREAAQYEDMDARRLLVRPGMTGLWQISGRSDLSWEESMRLDLYYVENWSIVQDLIILWRTVRAVSAGKGAY